jgi:predicted peptidase
MFAAAVPICGGGDVTQAKAIKDVPIWAFHGDKDDAVKVRRSRDMIAAIKAAGGSPKYTEYKDVGHDSWTTTYKDPELYKWLFAQKRAAKP